MANSFTYPAPEPALLRYGRAAVQQWRLAFAVLVIALVASVALGARTEGNYTASASVVIRTITNATTFPTPPPEAAAINRTPTLEVQFAQSASVQERAAETVGGVFNFTVEDAELTGTMSFTASGITAGVAAARANAAAAAYLAERHEVDRATGSEVPLQLQAALDGASETLDAIDAYVATLEAQIENARTPAELSIATGILSDYRAFVDRTDYVAAIAAATARVERTQPVIDFFDDVDNFSRLQQSGTQISGTGDGLQPSVVRGLLLGLVAAGLTIVAISYLDDRVTDEDDLEARLGGAPLLGSVPHEPMWEHSDKPRIFARGTDGAESITAIVNTLEFAQQGVEMQSVVIASHATGEGCSTVAANLAVTLARLGRSVALVDLNVRHPSLHNTFGVSNDWGVTNCVLENVGLAQLLVPIEGLEGLLVLPAGPRPQNPSEMLKSPRTAAVLQALASHYDHVVVDSAAMADTTDVSIAIAPHVDGVVLVGRLGKVRRRHIASMLRKAKMRNGTVAGAVTVDRPRAEPKPTETEEPETTDPKALEAAEEPEPTPVG